MIRSPLQNPFFFFRDRSFSGGFLSLVSATKVPWLWFASSYWPLEALRNSCCIALEFAPVPWLETGAQDKAARPTYQVVVFEVEKRWKFHESTRYGSISFWGEDAPEDYLSGHMLSCSKTCATVLDKNCLWPLGWLLMDALTLMIGNPPRKSSYRLEVNKVNNWLNTLLIFDYIFHNKNYDFNTVVQIHIQT